MTKRMWLWSAAAVMAASLAGEGAAHADLRKRWLKKRPGAAQPAASAIVPTEPFKGLETSYQVFALKLTTLEAAELFYGKPDQQSGYYSHLKLSGQGNVRFSRTAADHNGAKYAADLKAVPITVMLLMNNLTNDVPTSRIRDHLASCAQLASLAPGGTSFHLLVEGGVHLNPEKGLVIVRADYLTTKAVVCRVLRD